MATKAVSWPDFSKTVSRAKRRQFRRKLYHLGLIDQRAVWRSILDAFPVAAAACQAEIKVIDRVMRRVEQEVPSVPWSEDASKLSVQRGGEWPPGGYDATAMVRAIGERRFYPPQMITTSGHSYDIYLQDLHLRRVQTLLPETYNGSTIEIYDIHPSLRAKYRKKAHKSGVKNISNTH